MRHEHVRRSFSAFVLRGALLFALVGSFPACTSVSPGLEMGDAAAGAGTATMAGVGGTTADGLGPDPAACARTPRLTGTT